MSPGEPVNFSTDTFVIANAMNGEMKGIA